MLPRPEEMPVEGFPGWYETYGRAVIRGVTELAPQGGVSVGGNANDFNLVDYPVIWTCVGTS